MQQVIYIAYEDSPGPDSSEPPSTATAGASAASLELSLKEGQQICRLVAPINIDPLTFAAEYLKDLQSIPLADGDSVSAEQTTTTD